MSFVFEYFGWTDELMTVGSGFDNNRDRARKYKQWVKFRGPWAPGGGPGKRLLAMKLHENAILYETRSAGAPVDFSSLVSAEEPVSAVASVVTIHR